MGEKAMENLLLPNTTRSSISRDKRRQSLAKPSISFTRERQSISKDAAPEAMQVIDDLVSASIAQPVQVRRARRSRQSGQRTSTRSRTLNNGLSAEEMAILMN